nr:MAG TPA: hypothetical protein [Caudoviricetes sp.]
MLINVIIHSHIASSAYKVLYWPLISHKFFGILLI